MVCIPKFRRKPDQQTGDLQSILCIPSGQDFFLNPILILEILICCSFFSRVQPFSRNLHRRSIYEVLGGITIPSQELVMGVVQWHAGEHFQGRVSLLAVGFCVTFEQSDHVTVWGKMLFFSSPRQLVSLQCTVK